MKLYKRIEQICILLFFLAGVCSAASPQQEVLAAHWDEPFRPAKSAPEGSYMTMLRTPNDRYTVFINTWGTRDDGLQMWTGRKPDRVKESGIVLRSHEIDDLPDDKGKPHSRRGFTRPFLDMDPDGGFVGIVHVCRDYMPVDRRVYPALVSSPDGKRGSWAYHGRLKGEIWDEFGDDGKPVHSDGGGFFFQPDKADALNRAEPLENRYVFFTSHYSGRRHVNLLISADGEEWVFYRDAQGQIVNLIPQMAGHDLIFPQVIKLGEHGWSMTLSEKWPPVAIWRLWSPDGLRWQLLGAQPEIRIDPPGSLKNLSCWYDPEEEELHGYLTVYFGAGSNGSSHYVKYHSTTEQFTPESVEP